MALLLALSMIVSSDPATRMPQPVARAGGATGGSGLSLPPGIRATAQATASVRLMSPATLTNGVLGADSTAERRETQLVTALGLRHKAVLFEFN